MRLLSRNKLDVQKSNLNLDYGLCAVMPKTTDTRVGNMSDTFANLFQVAGKINVVDKRLTSSVALARRHLSKNRAAVKSPQISSARNRFLICLTTWYNISM